MTAGAHHIEIIFLANFAHRVIVSDPKRVRIRRLQLVENFAILVSAFNEGILILGVER